MARPIPAVSQIPAAVVSPLILLPTLMITPAHRKLMPLTACAATLAASALGNQHDQSSRTADQDVCPYTGVFKPLTAFHTDQGADNKCNDQPDTEPQILCHGKLTVIVCCKSHAFSSFCLIMLQACLICYIRIEPIVLLLWPRSCYSLPDRYSRIESIVLLPWPRSLQGESRRQPEEGYGRQIPLVPCPVSGRHHLK